MGKAIEFTIAKRNVLNGRPYVSRSCMNCGQIVDSWKQGQAGHQECMQKAAAHTCDAEEPRTRRDLD